MSAQCQTGDSPTSFERVTDHHPEKGHNVLSFSEAKTASFAPPKKTCCNVSRDCNSHESFFWGGEMMPFITHLFLLHIYQLLGNPKLEAQHLWVAVTQAVNAWADSRRLSVSRLANLSRDKAFLLRVPGLRNSSDLCLFSSAMIKIPVA